MKRSKTVTMKAQLEELADEFGVAIVTHRAEGPEVQHPLVYKAYKRRRNGKIDRTPLCMVPATQQGINQMLRTLNSLA